MVKSRVDSAVRPSRPVEQTAAAADVELGTPAWFNAMLLVATATILGVGSVGLLLAYFSEYQLWSALVAGLAVAAVLVVAGWSAVGASGQVCSARWPAVAMCAVAVASATLNIAFESNHVQVNRDPGVYAVTAKWIATQGSLQVPANPQWQASGVPVVLDSLGTYDESNGGVQLQFAHFVPAVFAVADGIGGDRTLFAMPAVLGAFALLAVFAVGCVVCRRRWLVFAAVTALAVSLPQLNVSRDTYSEAGTQLVLWVALWLILRWLATPSTRLAAVAGVALGAVLLTRIDALVFGVPLPILLVVLWHGRPGCGRDIGVFIAGILPGAALATLDLVERSAGYYRLLHSQIVQLRFGLVAAVVLGALLLWGLGSGRRWRRAEGLLARWSPTAVALILVAAWLVRPHVDHPRLDTPNDVVSGLQAHEGKSVNPYSSYGEKTLTWMSWYVGPITLALAILGVAALLTIALRSQRDARADAALAVLGLLGMASALYLWKPSIVPDQIWASRRFVPATLPLLVLAAAAGLELITDWLAKSDRRRIHLGVSAAVAVVVVAVPAVSSAKVLRYATQDGYLSIIDDTCAALGPHAAVVFQPGGRLDLTWPQTIRSWCASPTASLPPGATAAQVAKLTAVWRAAGRTLWVLSDSVHDVSEVLPSAQSVRELGEATSQRELIQTIARLPDGYTSETVRIFGAPA